MLTRETRNHFTGDIGEKFIVELMCQKGHSASLNYDPLDQLHDIFVDGVGYQVKTQPPYCLKNAISLRKTQFQKYKKNAVDVFFLTTKLKYPQFESLYGRIALVDLSKVKFWDEWSEGYDKVVIPFNNNPGLTLFPDRVPAKILALLKSHSTSIWR